MKFVISYSMMFFALAALGYLYGLLAMFLCFVVVVATMWNMW